MRVRSLVLLVLVGATSFGGQHLALAHAGGRAQLYVSDVRFHPAGDARTIAVTVIDADSGAPQPGFAVAVSGTAAGDRFGPVTLADAAGQGVYTATVNAAPGHWDVTVAARDQPGGPPAIPTTKRLRVDLTPGVPAAGTSARPPGSTGHRSSSAPAVVGGMAAAVAVTAGLLWSRRRSGRAPGRAGAETATSRPGNP
jgi:hypothetical protein